MKHTKDSGAVALLVVVVLGILLAALLLGFALFMFYVGGYNRAVGLDEKVTQAWADVDTQLQRRLDLVPNLVETVKGYATQEKELFENIARSREKYFQAGNVGQKIDASNQLGGFLSRLLVLQERYPDLKSNQNFLTLQDQLEGTENRISVARTRYNEAVKSLNTYERGFFGAYFSKKAGVEPREYFEATEQAQTEVPQVDFTAPEPTPRQEPDPTPDEPKPEAPGVDITTPKPKQATPTARP
jgi:LemA protein